ncbi:hypothetical protein FKM82_025801 [Ascaphus truei]
MSLISLALCSKSPLQTREFGVWEHKEEIIQVMGYYVAPCPLLYAPVYKCAKCIKAQPMGRHMSTWQAPSNWQPNESKTLWV